MNVSFKLKNDSLITISCHDVEKTVKEYLFYDRNYKIILLIKCSLVVSDSFKYFDNKY